MKKNTHIIPIGLYGAMPFFLGFLFVLVAVLPIKIPLIGTTIGPLIVMTVIFHAAVKYPSLLPAIGVFILGLLYDMLSSGPLGFWALLYLVCYMFSSSQKYLVGKEKLFASWLTFIFVALFSGLLSWGLGSLFYGHVAAIAEVLYGVLIACLFYPFTYLVLIPVDRRFDGGRIQGFGRA